MPSRNVPSALSMLSSQKLEMIVSLMDATSSSSLRVTTNDSENQLKFPNRGCCCLTSNVR